LGAPTRRRGGARHPEKPVNLYKYIAFAAFAALFTGCAAPDIDGLWEVEIEDTDLGAEGEAEGEMYLSSSSDGEYISGTLEVDLIDDCEEVEGDVTGWLDSDGEEIELRVEFQTWDCFGDSWSVEDLDVTLDLREDDGEVVEMDGDGDWGDGSIDFIADR